MAPIPASRTWIAPTTRCRSRTSSSFAGCSGPPARCAARGEASGASVAAHIFVVLTFRDGKIARYQEFHDEAAARDELY